MNAKVSFLLFIWTHLLNEFIYLTSHFEYICILHQPIVKVGDLVEYYAPQGTPHNPRDVCQGEVTEIFPSEGLNVITDTHLIIDGLHPVTYGRPIRVNKGEWISSNLCECIVDRNKDGLRRQSGKFKAIVNDAKEAFYEKESNSVGEVSEFIYYITSRNEWIQLLNELTYFKSWYVNSYNKRTGVLDEFTCYMYSLNAIEGKWSHVLYELIA